MLAVAVGFATAATVPSLAPVFGVFALSVVSVDGPFSAGDSEIAFESLATDETSPVTPLSEVATEAFASPCDSDVAFESLVTELSAESLTADDASLVASLADESDTTFESLATELFAASDDSLAAVLSETVADELVSSLVLDSLATDEPSLAATLSDATADDSFSLCVSDVALDSLVAELSLTGASTTALELSVGGVTRLLPSLAFSEFDVAAELDCAAKIELMMLLFIELAKLACELATTSAEEACL